MVILWGGHTEYTGYEGVWTSKPLEFGNEYSKELKYNDWALYREYGTKQFVDITQILMMLSTFLIKIIFYRVNFYP